MLKKLIKRSANSLGYEVRRLQRERWHEDPFLDSVHLLANQRVQVIFDVGSNIGNTVRRYTQLFPQATIYCFEPFEPTHAQLSSAYVGNHLVRVYRLALSDSERESDLFLNEASVMNSLLPLGSDVNAVLNPELTAAAGSVKVRTTTIDSFAQANNIESIQILKLDIQGAELLALRGAQNLLEQRRVDLIYLEVEFAELYQDQCFFWDIGGFLSEFGFRLYGLYNLRLTKDHFVGWCDALFVRPSAQLEPDTLSS